jgi:glutamine amidotransferase-like uncharacterized protein
MGDLVGRVLKRLGLPPKPLTRSMLASTEPLPFDALVFPGGWYFFDKKERDKIRAFVRHGGGYVGICCGAINACQLGLLPATLVEMSGLGPQPIEPVAGEHPLLQGVARKSVKPWRRYEPFTMVRFNGWPMKLKQGAQMIAAYDVRHKWAAIAVATFGKGRVVAISPHPEGVRFNRGDFHDQQKHRLTYDGFKMGTAPMLGNALRHVCPTSHA